MCQYQTQLSHWRKTYKTKPSVFNCRLFGLIHLSSLSLRPWLQFCLAPDDGTLSAPTGLELNGTGEVPPPLPLKGNTADYGNLQDTQDACSPSTPPPPPPHHRVGVVGGGGEPPMSTSLDIARVLDTTVQLKLSIHPFSVPVAS